MITLGVNAYGLCNTNCLFQRIVATIARVSSGFLLRGGKHSNCQIEGGEDHIVVCLDFYTSSVGEENCIVQ